MLYQQCLSFLGHLEKTLKALWVISLGPILSAMLTFYTPIEHTSYMHRVPLYDITNTLFVSAPRF